MKSVSPLLLLCLLFLPYHGPQGQEKSKSMGEKLAGLIRDADEVRVVYEDLSDPNPDAATGYQSVLPVGNQALAQAFADATLELFRDVYGINDPGLGISSSYMVINVRRKGALTGIIAVYGHNLHFIKPDNIWYTGSYKDAPWWDDKASLETSLIERRALGIIRAAVRQGGGWKEVGGDLKKFVRID